MCRISTDIDPDARLCILENYWAYFLGFGLPYFLLFKFTPFFIGYGFYLALFPFCIMLGSICDYKAAFVSNRLVSMDDSSSRGVGITKYHNSNNQVSIEHHSSTEHSSEQQYSNKKTVGAFNYPRIQVFQPARKLTLYLLKCFDEYIKTKRKMHTSSSMSSSSPSQGSRMKSD
jgi:hypothetical protein